MKESPKPHLDQQPPLIGSSQNESNPQAPAGEAKKRTVVKTVLRVVWRVICYSVIILVLMVLLPVLSRMWQPGIQGVLESANRAKALSNARNIGMALFTYANEHNGEFPPGNTAAEVYSHLLPQDGESSGYISDKRQFLVKGSKFTPPKDDAHSTPPNRLEAGENHWAFMQGPRRSRDGRWPLVFDGPAKSDGTYSAKKTEKGGVWEGKVAIVVRSDGSASVDGLKDLRLQGEDQTNLLVPTDRWLVGAKLLMPW